MTGRPGVLMVPDSTMLYVCEVCDTMRNVDSVMHEVGCTEICGFSPTKNQSGKRPLWGKNSMDQYIVDVQLADLIQPGLCLTCCVERK